MTTSAATKEMNDSKSASVSHDSSAPEAMQTDARPSPSSSQDSRRDKDRVLKILPAWEVERTSCSWASASRNMAIWRMIFFSIMTFYELGNPQILTPFGQLDIEFDMDQSRPGKDRWFGYNQFNWLQDLHAALGQDALRADRLHQLGYLCGFLAAFGKELKLPFWRAYTGIFTLLYLIRFLVKATSFTNHNYLFPLLMVLTLVSGGGHISGRVQHVGELRALEAATIAMRAQFSLLYFFASLWKIHGDWLAGRIVQEIFLSFEGRRKARGIPWAWIESQFPPIFVLLAISGLILDSSMFVMLTFLRPKAANTRIFLIFALLFHVFTTVAMGEVIGYSFPSTCVAGLAVFLPLRLKRTVLAKQIVVSYDHAVVTWISIYWNSAVEQLFKYNNNSSVDANGQGEDVKAKKDIDKPSPRLPPSWLNLFVVGWVVWQTWFPLRMVLVSRGNFSYNRLGYRYSWTMMMHNHVTGIVRRNPGGTPEQIVILLSYLVPTCFRPEQPSTDVFMPREVYMGLSSTHPMQDSRSVPMHVVLKEREAAMLVVFPAHFLSRISFGIARIIDHNAGMGACKMQGFLEQERMGMHAVYFAQLNQHGPFSRLIDPTVDLVRTAEAQQRQSYLTTVWNSLWDKRPTGHEFLLRKGIGSMRSEALQMESRIKQRFPASKIAMIADRGSCLKLRPLWLRPMGAPYVIVPLVLPAGMHLVVRADESSPAQDPNGRDRNWKVANLWPDQTVNVKAFALEIGLDGGQGTMTPCGETDREDVLFAFVYAEY